MNPPLPLGERYEAPVGIPAARGSSMRSEIEAQPGLLCNLIDSSQQEIARAADAIRRHHPRFVMLAGRGTSGHVARFARILIETRLGLPTGLISPSTFTMYEVTPDLSDVVLLSISQGGTSPDLVGTVQAARQFGALTVSITNAASSPVATESDLHLDVLAGPERAVVATKSYTAQLMMTWLLIEAWRGGTSASARLVPEAIRRMLAREREVESIAHRFRFADRAVVIGRGYSFVTAREAALKLMEAVYVAAQAMSSADLLHGPVAMLDPRHPVIAVVPQGRSGVSLSRTLDVLRRAELDLTIFGDEADAGPCNAHFPDGHRSTAVGQHLRPLVDIIPLQLLSLHMALARGIDPDSPRGLVKETHTF